jgi:predicted RNA binding protein YcfA (HicA-like mRNA interferase family)
MPKKIRELKGMLAKAGFSSRPGKGSHSAWTHPRWRGRPIVLAGNDGRDARRYQEKQVEAAIRSVGGNP